MYNSPLTSEPPSHWSNHDEKTSHWSDPDIHSDRNTSKPNYLEEEEEDLPEDYAFLGGLKTFIRKNVLFVFFTLIIWNSNPI